jgi:hypothetical protein
MHFLMTRQHNYGKLVRQSDYTLRNKPFTYEISNYNNKSVALVRERTIPTEQTPLVGEVSANVCRWRVPRGQHNGSLRPYSRISRP